MTVSPMARNVIADGSGVASGTMVDGAAKLYGLRSVLGRGDGPHSMDYPPTRWP